MAYLTCPGMVLGTNMDKPGRTASAKSAPAVSWQRERSTLPLDAWPAEWREEDQIDEVTGLVGAHCALSILFKQEIVRAVISGERLFGKRIALFIGIQQGKCCADAQVTGCLVLVPLCVAETMSAPQFLQ